MIRTVSIEPSTASPAADRAPAAEPAEDLQILCPECDYNLTGITGERCPWCGWEIDVDVLVAQAGARTDSRRFGVAFAAAVVGIGSFVALASLMVRGRELSVLDALAVLAVVMAAVGHLALAVLALLPKRRWPMRKGAASDLLLFVAILSLATGVFGASRFLWDIRSPRVVRGVVVNGVLEFSIAAFFFALPAVLLLALRLLSFRHPKLEAVSPRRTEHGKSSLPTESTFSVDFSREYRPEQIGQVWIEQPRPSTPEIDDIIRSTWDEQVEKATAKCRRLYDGQLVRLIELRALPSRLELTLGPTGFREFLGTNLYQPRRVSELLPAALANPIGISATVATIDHVLVFGRRSDNVAFHAGHLHTIGGLVEETDRGDDGRFDFFGAMLRELREELGVEAKEIRDIRLMGLVRDRAILQPELVLDIALHLNRKQINERFNASAPGQEHAALEMVFDEPDTVIPFLRRAAPVAPVAEAAVLLHGRRVWGQEWYEQTCYILYGELPPTTAALATNSEREA
jgi:8-oxo-dGTP pyrophosphatase MutT (NUDIX family)